jgi:hypothetical protein
VFSLEVGDYANIAYCLEGLAAVAVARGGADRAALLLGAAQRLRDGLGASCTPTGPTAPSRSAPWAPLGHGWVDPSSMRRGRKEGRWASSRPSPTRSRRPTQQRERGPRGPLRRLHQ